VEKPGIFLVFQERCSKTWRKSLLLSPTSSVSLSRLPLYFFWALEVFGLLLCHVVCVCLSLIRPPIPGGGVGHLFQVVF
jgi:hypothetical protein